MPRGSSSCGASCPDVKPNIVKKNFFFFLAVRWPVINQFIIEQPCSNERLMLMFPLYWSYLCNWTCDEYSWLNIDLFILIYFHDTQSWPSQITTATLNSVRLRTEFKVLQNSQKKFPLNLIRTVWQWNIWLNKNFSNKSVRWWKRFSQITDFSANPLINDLSMQRLL